MGMTKAAAQAVVDSLKACPFCGRPLTATIRGASDWAPNPSAKCTTVDCWGGQLPALSLDIPEHVAAYNTRWAGQYPPGTLTCADCGAPESALCSCPDSPMAERLGSPERAAAIAAAKKKGLQ